VSLDQRLGLSCAATAGEPDPGHALTTGRADDTVTVTFDHANAFKISPLRGIRKTAPYFDDNSAKTLADVLNHYQQFFLIVSDRTAPRPGPAAHSAQRSGQEGHHRVPRAARLR
jgi:cytochrome c peroxidase